MPTVAAAERRDHPSPPSQTKKSPGERAFLHSVQAEGSNRGMLGSDFPDAPVIGNQENIGRPRRKNTDSYYAGNTVDAGFHLDGIRYLQVFR